MLNEDETFVFFFYLCWKDTWTIPETQSSICCFFSVLQKLWWWRRPLVKKKNHKSFCVIANEWKINKCVTTMFNMEKPFNRLFMLPICCCCCWWFRLCVSVCVFSEVFCAFNYFSFVRNFCRFFFRNFFLLYR